jgi:hypothetical protein
VCCQMSLCFAAVTAYLRLYLVAVSSFGAMGSNVRQPPRQCRHKGQEFNICARREKSKYHSESKRYIDFECALYFDI